MLLFAKAAKLDFDLHESATFAVHTLKEVDGETVISIFTNVAAEIKRQMSDD